jgi:predicted permease
METILQNIRYGVRQLRRAPLFTVAAVATLGLGIGANTALFTLGSAIMTKPLTGVLQSDRLLWVMNDYRGGRPNTVSWPDFVDYRAGLSDKLELAGSAENKFALSGTEEPVQVEGIAVTGNWFTVLRTPFALGRGFLPSDDSVGVSRPVVVLSHRLWRTRYASDSSIVGKQVKLNGVPATVLGVTVAGFNGADLEEPRGVFLPFATFRAVTPAGNWDNRSSRWLKGIGRLKDGVSEAQVRVAAQTIAVRNAAADSVGHEGVTAGIYSAKSGLPPGAERQVTPVAALGAMVTGLILLIACANVSNLLLARGVQRRREVGIRLSLGATRMRLMGQLLTESLILAVISAGVGVLLAYWSTDFILTSGTLPLEFDVRPDFRVITFTITAAAFAAIVFGLVPAIEATRTDLAAAVKDGTAARDPRRARIQSTFVVTQLALSLVLLTTAGLFLRSMQKASSIETGFEASTQVLGVSFDLGTQNYSVDKANAFITQLDERARALPGVQSTTFTTIAPMGNRYVMGELLREGDDPAPANGRESYVNQPAIRPGYFEVMGMKVLRGRDFNVRDDKTAPWVVILSEETAKKLWPAENAIGKRVRLGRGSQRLLTVVGIASDVMLGGPTDARQPTAYVPQLQDGLNQLHQTMLIRTAGETGKVAEAVRRAVRDLDADLPLFNVQTLAQYKEIKLSSRMDGATILAGFGALALLLASIGVYAMMAFSVLQRTREIGIRIALGARGSEVIALFVRRGMRLTAIGVGIGIALSLAVGKLMQGLLFGLTPTDTATFVGVAGLLALVALAACWFPARRAAAVDPLNALRSE